MGFPISGQRRAVERGDGANLARRRIGHLGRQEHVLEVGGGVIGVGPARRIAVGRRVRLHGEISVECTGGGIPSKPRSAKRHAVDDCGIAACGLGVSLESEHLPVGRGRGVDADDQRALSRSLPIEHGNHAARAHGNAVNRDRHSRVWRDGELDQLPAARPADDRDGPRRPTVAIHIFQDAMCADGGGRAGNPGVVGGRAAKDLH